MGLLSRKERYLLAFSLREPAALVVAMLVAGLAAFGFDFTVLFLVAMAVTLGVRLHFLQSPDTFFNGRVGAE